MLPRHLAVLYCNIIGCGWPSSIKLLFDQARAATFVCIPYSSIEGALYMIWLHFILWHPRRRDVPNQCLLLMRVFCTMNFDFIYSVDKDSGYWLQAIPLANVGTLLDGVSFTLAVCLRLGATTVHPHQMHVW